MKIGIFGGTFDPFTCAHYEIVKKVLNDKLVDKVIVIPTIVDYYRKDKVELFDLSSRRQIIERWFKNADNVILDFHEYDVATNPRRYYDDPEDIHMRRYIHMLNDLISRWGSMYEYYTAIGGDSWNKLNTWHEWEKLFDLTDFIVVKRDEDKLEQHFIEYSDQCWTCPKIEVTLDKKFADVSATKIRKRLENEISGMSMGSGTTCLNLYLEEIDGYLKTGKTAEDRRQEYLETEKEAKKLAGNYFDKIDFDSIKREAVRKATSAKAYDYLKKIENTPEQSEELLARTPIFDVVKCTEVESGFRPVKIKSSDWVSIIVEKDGKFLMEKQFRHGLEKEFEEFPCGMVEDGEFANKAALRELEEETGIRITDDRSLHYLGKFAANPAFMTNYMHYFHINLDYANYKLVDTKLDAHEHIVSYWEDKREAFKNFNKSEGSAIMGCAWMILIREHIFPAVI